MDPFLHDKRIDSLTNELKIYASKIHSHNIAVITQNNEPEIMKICADLDITYHVL